MSDLEPKEKLDTKNEIKFPHQRKNYSLIKFIFNKIKCI